MKDEYEPLTGRTDVRFVLTVVAAAADTSTSWRDWLPSNWPELPTTTLTPSQLGGWAMVGLPVLLMVILLAGGRDKGDGGGKPKK
jgi:hypothetical protein